MRILLAQNAPYYPAHGGGDISNRLLVEALAARGHDCRAIARLGNLGPEEHARHLAELAARGVEALAEDEGAVRYRLRGVGVEVVTSRNPRAYFTQRVRQLEPEVILASTDDPAQILLEAALASGTPRVVYLARATLALPFGPDCAFPSAAKTARIARADAVVGVSRYVAEYMRRWGPIADAVHVPLSLMETGPWPLLADLGNEFVTLVNPCAVKGISIFLALAEQMPGAAFAAVPTWGATAEDRLALSRLPNVTLLEPVDNIDHLFARTRVLLVPSLWAEARSRIIVEAMLRGVPVLASNVGGIPEAMMGVPYLLPVRPIEKYQPRLDGRMVPVAEVPPQDAGPWRAALERLLNSPGHYQEVSAHARQAALNYAANLNVLPFERLLQETLAKPRRAAATQTPAGTPPPSALEGLSPERRRLLALKLKQRRPASVWFPGADAAPPDALRLFCFPSAGGGVSLFARWQERLPAGAAVCPARLPGRESRAAEPPPPGMEPLVRELAAALEPHLASPFAFFGHSMGAAVAFELARELRRRGRPLPACLFASGARAPRFRRGHVPPPDPDEEQFLAEVRRLEGIPAEVLDNSELMALVLPVLRADAALYRRYVYSEEPPLDCPIRAYGGESDPNVTSFHLEAWREETVSSFGMRTFPGGHFYLRTHGEEFLAALAADLEECAHGR